MELGIEQKAWERIQDLSCADLGLNDEPLHTQEPPGLIVTLFHNVVRKRPCNVLGVPPSISICISSRTQPARRSTPSPRPRVRNSKWAGPSSTSIRLSAIVSRSIAPLPKSKARRGS